MPAARFVARYVSDDLRARADDVVWRVRCGGHDLYLLIEFQSTSDSFIWLDKVLFARFKKGTAIVNNLWEEQTMLSERLDQWEAEFLQRGRQAGRQEGLEEGLQEGRQEGRQEGEVALLMRLLRKRFGELPPSVSDRLKLAQPAQLERWGDRLLEARSLSELLD
jgi:predicted transposase YdaD